MVSESDAHRRGPGGVAGSALDEERLAEQRLQSLGRLAGGVAHDFNNVLGVILGYVELARMQLGPESGPAADHLAQALSTLDRARALTARLLAFVHGTGTEEDGRVDPNLVVDDMKDLLAETLDRRIIIRVTVANDTPWVEIEREHLAHALLNLCIDAAERMPNGGTLSVDVRRREITDSSAPVRPGTYARVDVRDSGSLSRSRDASTGGMGVAHDLAVGVRGALTVGHDSDGTVSSLWLPALVIDLGKGDVQPEPAKGVTILVVDDEAGVRDVTRAHLEHAGYTVREAETAERAIDLVTAAPEAFAVVLLDLHLPDRPGTEVFETLKELRPAPAFVIVTGDLEWADEAGIPDTAPRLAKPFLRHALLDAVTLARGSERS